MESRHVCSAFHECIELRFMDSTAIADVVVHDVVFHLVWGERDKDKMLAPHYWLAYL